MDVAEQASVALDAVLVREAEALGIDVAEHLARELAYAIERRKRERAFQEENAEAIAAYNAHVEKHGLWYRDFVAE